MHRQSGYTTTIFVILLLNTVVVTYLSVGVEKGHGLTRDHSHDLPADVLIAGWAEDDVLYFSNYPTDDRYISRNWRSKGLRGIRSLRNSMFIENVWTHSENCS